MAIYYTNDTTSPEDTRSEGNKEGMKERYYIQSYILNTFIFNQSHLIGYI